MEENKRKTSKLIILDTASFCLLDRQKLHFIYGLDLSGKVSILLLGSAVLMLKEHSDFSKLLNACELFGISNIYVLSRDIDRFRLGKKKIIPITRLASLKNFIKNYDLIIKL